MLGRVFARLAPEDDGFTLSEMLVVMVILSIVIVAFVELLSLTITRSGRTQEQATLQTEVRAGLDAMTSELRQAMCNDQTSPMTTATASQITFYTPDRQTPYHLRQVSYQQSGQLFQRAFVTSTNTGGPAWTMPSLSTATWATVFGSVTSTNPFTYRDANGNVTATLSQITQVDVSVTVAPHGTTGNDGSTTYASSIDLRTPTCNS